MARRNGNDRTRAELAFQKQKAAEKQVAELTEHNTKLSDATVELAGKLNGMAVLLAAVLEFHHAGSATVPQALVKEIEEADQNHRHPGLNCEIKNGQVLIFIGPPRSGDSLKA